MKKDSVKTEFKLTFKLRMPPELVKWLVAATLMGGGAVSALAHWITLVARVVPQGAALVYLDKYIGNG